MFDIVFLFYCMRIICARRLKVPSPSFARSPLLKFSGDIAFNAWSGVTLSTTSRAYVMQATSRSPIQQFPHVYVYSSSHGHAHPTARFAVLEVALRYARYDLI